MDEREYHSVIINKDLTRVFCDDVLVGQVRRGMDMLWYPELPADRFQPAAIQAVILAHAAITEYVESVNGHD